MKTGKTLLSGGKTATATKRYTALSISGKDPQSDYSFRRVDAIEAGGGQDMYGYEPVKDANYAGETWDGPVGMTSKTRGTKQIRYQDVILCKRHKSVSDHFKRIEDEQYNAQTRLVLSAARMAKEKLRSIDPDCIVEDQASGKLEISTKEIDFGTSQFKGRLVAFQSLIIRSGGGLLIKTKLVAPDGKDGLVGHRLNFTIGGICYCHYFWLVGVFGGKTHRI